MFCVMYFVKIPYGQQKMSLLENQEVEIPNDVVEGFCSVFM